MADNGSWVPYLYDAGMRDRGAVISEVIACSRSDPLVRKSGKCEEFHHVIYLNKGVVGRKGEEKFDSVREK